MAVTPPGGATGPKRGTGSVKKAKAVLRKNGFSRAALAKTTGTTKGEVTRDFRQAARKLAAGKKAPLKRLKADERGGPTAGVASSPKRTANVKKRATAVRRAAGYPTKPKIGGSLVKRPVKKGPRPGAPKGPQLMKRGFKPNK